MNADAVHLTSIILVDPKRRKPLPFYINKELLYCYLSTLGIISNFTFCIHGCRARYFYGVVGTNVQL